MIPISSSHETARGVLSAVETGCYGGAGCVTALPTVLRVIMLCFFQSSSVMRLQDVECVIKSLNTFKHFSYLGTGKMLNDDKSEGLVKKKKKKKNLAQYIL